MNLADYLAPDAVTIRNDLKSKKRALEEISRLLAQSARYVSENEVFTSLINREKLGSTALGDGVAIPHGRLSGLKEAVAAFIRLDQGIEYEGDAGDRVDLVFGLLVPKEANSQHLEILAAIAGMFQNETQRAAIRASQDPAALHKLLTGFKAADS